MASLKLTIALCVLFLATFALAATFDDCAKACSDVSLIGSPEGSEGCETGDTKKDNECMVEMESCVKGCYRK